VKIGLLAKPPRSDGDHGDALFIFGIGFGPAWWWEIRSARVRPQQLSRALSSIYGFWPKVRARTAGAPAHSGGCVPTSSAGQQPIAVRPAAVAVIRRFLMVPSEMRLEFGWRILRSHEVIVSGGKVNWLIDGFCGESLPAIDLAHVDLP
jgi:hypothetical protein